MWVKMIRVTHTYQLLHCSGKALPEKREFQNGLDILGFATGRNRFPFSQDTSASLKINKARQGLARDLSN